MKSAKMTISIALAVLMTSVAFTGCSTAGMELANAYGKNQTINSMVSRTDLSINVSASNLTENEKQMMDNFLPMINSSKISAEVLVMQNQDKTTSRVKENFTLMLGQMPLNITAWVDMNLNSENGLKEIIKMPDILNSQLPAQFKGKEYLIMSSNDMNNIQGAPVINYKNLINFTKNYQTSLENFSSGFTDKFNPGTGYVTKTGTENINVDGRLQPANVYELKLSDATLKSLMRYTINNIADNPDSINFVKSFLNDAMSIYEPNKEIDAMKTEMNQALANFSNNLPMQVESMNKSLDSIKNLKMLGDKGLEIKYYVNEDGYIVKEQGTAQFIIDLPELNRISHSNMDNTGVYTINLNFNTKISSINSLTYINLPVLDDSNSYKYTDLLKSMSQKQ